MASGRKVERAEARELLAEWSRSGEKISSWCEARGLNWYSLNAYHGRWLASARPVFAEVVVSETPVETIRNRSCYRIDFGDVVIEVDDAFRTETLQRLVQAVAAC